MTAQEASWELFLTENHVWTMKAEISVHSIEHFCMAEPTTFSLPFIYVFFLTDDQEVPVQSVRCCLYRYYNMIWTMNIQYQLLLC